jgi:hypothetical protein
MAILFMDGRIFCPFLFVHQAFIIEFLQEVLEQSSSPIAD